MTLEISSDGRAEIKSKVIEILEKYGTPSLPLKIGSIIRNMPHVKLITYSSQIRKYNISYNELIINAETKDSYAVFQASTKRFCIYYNDLDVNITSSNRVRWNLAHELGHIVLNHHQKIGLNKLYRTGIDDATYNYFEKEADYFAQLILVPHAVLYAFKIQNSTNIKYLCKISSPASRKRYYEYVKWKSHVNTKDEYDNRIFRYYYDFIYKRQCKHCGAKLIQRYGKYCPICGNKNSLQWGDGKMIYPKLETYEDGKLKDCPICQNEETHIEGEYCIICGNPLVNTCSNEECSHQVLPSNARYCPICGSETTFYRRGILKAWDYNEDDLPPEDGFMNIPDTDETMYISNIDEELPFN